MNITSTQLKQQTHLLSKVKEEEIVVTKRDKPFAVIVDYDKYNELVKKANKEEIQKKLDILDSIGSYDLGGKSYQEIKSEMK